MEKLRWALCVWIGWSYLVGAPLVVLLYRGARLPAWLCNDRAEVERVAGLDLWEGLGDEHRGPASGQGS